MTFRIFEFIDHSFREINAEIGSAFRHMSGLGCKRKAGFGSRLCLWWAMYLGLVYFAFWGLQFPHLWIEWMTWPSRFAMSSAPASVIWSSQIHIPFEQKMQAGTRIPMNEGGYLQVCIPACHGSDGLASTASFFAWEKVPFQLHSSFVVAEGYNGNALQPKHSHS